MEKTSDGGEEVKGGLGIPARAVEDAATMARPLLGLLEVEEEGEPDGEVVVAQSTRAVLDVGLQVKDGVAEFGVADTGDLAQLLRDVVPLAQEEVGHNGLVELLVEGEMAGEEAAVKGGQGEFEVVGIEAAGLLEGSGSRTGAQTDIPHALDDGAGDIPVQRLGLFVGIDEEDVDVREGKEIFAAVAAQCDQGDGLCGLGSKGAAPQLNQDAVYDSRTATNGSRAVACALAGLAHKCHLPLILLPKIVNR